MRPEVVGRTAGVEPLPSKFGRRWLASVTGNQGKEGAPEGAGIKIGRPVAWTPRGSTARVRPGAWFRSHFGTGIPDRDP